MQRFNGQEGDNLAFVETTEHGFLVMKLQSLGNV